MKRWALNQDTNASSLLYIARELVEGEGSMAWMFLNYAFILIVVKKRITECAAHGVEC